MDNLTTGVLFLMVTGALVVLTVVVLLAPKFFNYLYPFKKMKRKELEKYYDIENKNINTRGTKH